ncbi:hypothetical protein MKW98_026432 [Papaver atlanticum]|uniref:Uncharacterized protein n=1 Tax=Papaver atlanticum TaxID=357466 RepID=A0AAD4TA30_9MAGN|nr:hypothetical protein MKW98_026432 [Papaver atlanticum]
MEEKPMGICGDDETQLMLHGLAQHHIKLSNMEKNRKLKDLDSNQVVISVKSVSSIAELNIGIAFYFSVYKA